MRLNIKTYLVAHNSASNHPVGTIIPCQPCSYKESGWDSVVQFQKDRMLHHLGHYREFAVPMKDGVKIIERFGNYGFKRVMECTLEETDHVASPAS